jgi:hypothetical protein
MTAVWLEAPGFMAARMLRLLFFASSRPPHDQAPPPGINPFLQSEVARVRLALREHLPF